jgi:CO/xanthine dehydrogenase FAD-binding subunit
MLNLETIYKPTSLAQALALVQQPGTVVLGGGTDILARGSREIHAVVDLGGLGLTGVEAGAGEIVIGARTTLAGLVESTVLRDAAGGVIPQAAHATHASILRNQATIAGTLIACPDSILAVALLALDASLRHAVLENGQVTVHDLLLRDVLKRPGDISIVTAVVIPMSSASRRARLETVARTPRDRPIVAVCAALGLAGGIVQACSIALGGVATTAWRAPDAERTLLYQGLTDEVIARAAMAALSGLEPPSDFRGSTAYRSEMARVLTARTLRALAESTGL